MSVTIRKAVLADSELIFSFVRELADYEKLSAEVASDPQAITAVLFASEPRVFCDIAEWDNEPAGFAVWFLNFSTFRGRYGMAGQGEEYLPGLREVELPCAIHCQRGGSDGNIRSGHAVRGGQETPTGNRGDDALQVHAPHHSIAGIVDVQVTLAIQGQTIS